MKVLFVLPAEGFGGAERQGVLAMQLLPEFGIEVLPVVGPGQPIRQALEAAGIQRYVFTTDFPRSFEVRTARDRVRQPLQYALSWRRAYMLVQRLVQQHNIELLLASRAFGWITAGAAGRHTNCPVVWRAGSRPTSRHQLAWLRLGAWLYPPEAVVYNSRVVQEQLTPYIRISSLLIPNGVDLEQFDPRRASPTYRQELGLEQAKVVGIAARPSKEKGFDMLPALVAKLAQALPGVHVLVAGDYSSRSHYQRLLSAQAPTTVTFLGHVHDMASFYQSCDLVVLPSRQQSVEALPNAVLEAMAMEKAVVATRVGAVEDLIHHGVDGILCPPDDSQAIASEMIALLQSPERRQALGRAARTSVASRFGSRAVVARLAELLRAVVHEANVYRKRTGTKAPPGLVGELVAARLDTSGARESSGPTSLEPETHPGVHW